MINITKELIEDLRSGTGTKVCWRCKKEASETFHCSQCEVETLNEFMRPLRVENESLFVVARTLLQTYRPQARDDCRDNTCSLCRALAALSPETLKKLKE